MKATEVINLLDAFANKIGRLFILLLAVIVITKRPVVAATTLFIESVLWIEAPLDKIFVIARLELILQALLDNFGLHIDQYCVRMKCIRAEVPLKVRLDCSLRH